MENIRRKPIISVIVPIFNAGKFLDETIQSVINQTFTDWELILVDDGSTDDSLIIASEYSKKDDRIKSLQHPGGVNLGVSCTRNLGIKYSAGTFIALLDSDDTWYRNKLEKQIDIFIRYPDISLVYHKLKTKFDLENFVFPEICGSGTVGRQDYIYKKMVRDKVWMPNSSVVFNANVLNKTGLFNEKLKYQIEDHLFFTKCTYHFKSYFLDEILGEYRIHSSSYTTNTRWENSFYEFWFYLLIDRSIKDKAVIFKAIYENIRKRLVIA
jgi:glycosyltransferase involved in cell wall biosynthesis